MDDHTYGGADCLAQSVRGNDEELSQPVSSCLAKRLKVRLRYGDCHCYLYCSFSLGRKAGGRAAAAATAVQQTAQCRIPLTNAFHLQCMRCANTCRLLAHRTRRTAHTANWCQASTAQNCVAVAVLLSIWGTWDLWQKLCSR